MAELLYLSDAYLKETDATVTSLDPSGKVIMLDKTIFYATGGGQPHDQGTITYNDQVYHVLMVRKLPEGIAHELDKPGLKQGDKVHCILDWQRRYKLMRSHTAAHLLGAVIYQQTKVETTGNQLEVDKSRMDFCLDDASKERIESFMQKANDLIQKNASVKVYALPKEEAIKDPTLFKLAIKDYIEKLKEVRVVEIKGIDKQADGGTHVQSLREIGAINLLKIENKGKNNKRLYFTLHE